MVATLRKTLEAYLALPYPFNVKVDPAGGYVALFPDLPGCFTEADSLEELPAMVAEARALWIETAYAQGIAIPLPSVPDRRSGKILLRVTKSMHRRLLDQSAREGVSLNHYASTLLARGDAQSAVEKHLVAIDHRLNMLADSPKPHQIHYESLSNAYSAEVHAPQHSDEFTSPADETPKKRTTSGKDRHTAAQARTE